jgi:hypothetical protein
VSQYFGLQCQKGIYLRRLITTFCNALKQLIDCCDIDIFLRKSPFYFSTEERERRLSMHDAATSPIYHEKTTASEEAKYVDKQLLIQNVYICLCFIITCIIIMLALF